MENINRRTFITGAAAVAGAGLLAETPSLAQAKTSTPTIINPIFVNQIGTNNHIHWRLQNNHPITRNDIGKHFHLLVTSNGNIIDNNSVGVGYWMRNHGGKRTTCTHSNVANGIMLTGTITHHMVGSILYITGTSTPSAHASMFHGTISIGNTQANTSQQFMMPDHKTSHTKLTLPQAALAAGIKNLVFHDDFTSISTIDTSCTGKSGYNWYPAGIHAWGQKDTTTAEYSVANSVLHLNPQHSDWNGNFKTADPQTGNGHSFGFGYYEARMKFPNPNGCGILPDGSMSWGAFWGKSQSNIMGKTSDNAELDFFESGPTNGQFNGTLHSWNTDGTKYAFRNTPQPVQTGVDMTQWHTYGCLWLPGQVHFYLDNKPMNSVTWNTDGSGGQNPPAIVENTTDNPPVPADAYCIFDKEPSRMGLNVLLGTGVGSPMDVDWVHIYTK